MKNKKVQINVEKPQVVKPKATVKEQKTVKQVPVRQVIVDEAYQEAQKQLDKLQSKYIGQ